MIPSSSATKAPAWLAPAAAASGGVALLVGVARRSPFTPGHWLGCPLHSLTGVYCPLCGSTRAAFALVHGDWVLMMGSNPVLPLVLLLVGWTWIRWLGMSGGWWSLPLPPHGRTARWLAAGFVILFSAARNISALAILAPHGHP
ncbi:MAG: DUF2752 domain-containing protein [Pseudonocardiaceae bacterium]